MVFSLYRWIGYILYLHYSILNRFQEKWDDINILLENEQHGMTMDQVMFQPIQLCHYIYIIQ